MQTTPTELSEEQLLAADRDYNERKAERTAIREAEYALDLQIKHTNPYYPEVLQ